VPPELLLAHSWGWDEALLIGIPVIGAVFWVRWAEKRARQRRADAADGEGGGDPGATMPGHDNG
jgi:hypothetical protein